MCSYASHLLHVKGAWWQINGCLLKTPVDIWCLSSLVTSPPDELRLLCGQCCLTVLGTYKKIGHEYQQGLLLDGSRAPVQSDPLPFCAKYSQTLGRFSDCSNGTTEQAGSHIHITQKLSLQTLLKQHLPAGSSGGPRPILGTRPVPDPESSLGADLRLRREPALRAPVIVPSACTT